MNINIHAGHNPDGKIGSGAVGLIRESTENRKVKDEVIKILREHGHLIYDCTVNDGKNQNDVLAKIVKKCNEHKVDVDISIHFNAGAKDISGNGKTTGTEILVYNYNSNIVNKIATNILRNISALGYKNRGIKANKDLYILRNTFAPAMLIECCFVDDKDDVLLYDYKTMAKAIACGIIGVESKNTIIDANENYYQKVKEKYNFDDNTMQYLKNYKYGDELIKRLATK